jgi:hypothetical protein
MWQSARNPQQALAPCRFKLLNSWVGAKWSHAAKDSVRWWRLKDLGRWAARQDSVGVKAEVSPDVWRAPRKRVHDAFLFLFFGGSLGFELSTLHLGVLCILKWLMLWLNLRQWTRLLAYSFAVVLWGVLKNLSGILWMSFLHPTTWRVSGPLLSEGNREEQALEHAVGLQLRHVLKLDAWKGSFRDGRKTARVLWELLTNGSALCTQDQS